MNHSDKYATTLIHHVRNYLTRINDAHLNSFLSHWPEPDGPARSLSKSTLPVLTWLPDVIKAATPDTVPIAKLLATAANHLAWGQTYLPEDFGSIFLERYGWTELVGTRGVIASNRIACGFLLLGPEIEYPSHRHEAEEIYVPLTGQTYWMRNNKGWISRDAGLPIYHETWMPHAIRTDAVPLLAIYLWQGGDLAQKSLID